MTKLSVNINKVATLRNARGGNNPDLLRFAQDAERYGAQGITVHPRPDQRHIRRQDVYDLKKVIRTEFNIEGYPDRKFLELLKEIRPDQATLVPDPPEVLTSDAGWDTLKHTQFLTDVISEIKSYGIRTSLFIAPDPVLIEAAAQTGTDRIELYTEAYAKSYSSGRENAIHPYILAAEKAGEVQLGLNAGHDLSIENLKYFKKNIPALLEVSIGHALICDALYFGIENTIQLYRRQLT